MAKVTATVETNVKVTFILSIAEAKLLAAMMQNPIGYDPDHEPRTESDLRHAIFDELQAITAE